MLDLLHPEAVRQGGVHLDGFGGNAALLVHRQGVEGADVVQPIGQLDEQHPDVTGHGDNHFADGGRLGFLPRGELDAVELGDPVDEPRHLRPEIGGDDLKGGRGVLHRVVEQRRLQGGAVHPVAGQDGGDDERVDDERLAGEPPLPGVELVGPPVGALDGGRVGSGMIGGELGDDAGEQLVGGGQGLDRPTLGRFSLRHR